MLTVKDREFSFKIMFISTAVERKLAAWVKRMKHRWYSDESAYGLMKQLADEAGLRKVIVTKIVSEAYAAKRSIPSSFRTHSLFYLDCVFQIRFQALEYEQSLSATGKRKVSGKTRRAQRDMEKSLRVLAAQIEEVYSRTMPIQFDENWDRILLEGVETKTSRKPAN